MKFNIEIIEKFLNDNVFIYALDTRKTYEEFRKLKVHTYEVDALLKLNLDALESVFIFLREGGN